MIKLKERNGFTLVELAIALVIVGILIGFGASLIGPLTKRAKLIETRETVKAVYEAILGYAASNKRLPTNLNALGLKTKDSYGADLRYYRVDNFVSNNFCISTGTYLSVTDRGTTKNNVAFILFGEGENRCNQTGTSSPFIIRNEGEVAACTQDANASYDDIVIYADINKLREMVCTPFSVTTETLPIGSEEMAYPSTTLEATDGTPPYKWSISAGSLPPDLSLSSAGVISGTPRTDGSYNFTISVTDSDNSPRIATKSLTITINPNKPRITTEFLSYGTEGIAYPSTTLSATGGKAPYTWSLQSGSLPPGLSLLGGSISGVPTAAGTYSFTVRVTDSGSPQRTHDKTLSIAINPASSSSSNSSSISSSSSTSSTSTSASTSISSLSSSGNPNHDIKVWNYDISKTIGYKENKGTCQYAISGSSFTVKVGNSYNLYSTLGCEPWNLKAFKPYNDFKAADSNGDSNVKITDVNDSTIQDLVIGSGNDIKVWNYDTAGRTLGYKENGGTCQYAISGSSFTVKVGNSYNLYSTSGCEPWNLKIIKPYNDFKNADGNNNLNVKITDVNDGSLADY